MTTSGMAVHTKGRTSPKIKQGSGNYCAFTTTVDKAQRPLKQKYECGHVPWLGSMWVCPHTDILSKNYSLMTTQEIFLFFFATTAQEILQKAIETFKLLDLSSLRQEIRTISKCIEMIQ